VAAFEQSLGNMTIRLQSLTMTAEQKDSELNELRKTIELLKKQNAAAQAAINGVINTPELNCKGKRKRSSLQPHLPALRNPPLTTWGAASLPRGACPCQSDGSWEADAFSP